VNSHKKQREWKDISKFDRHQLILPKEYRMFFEGIRVGTQIIARVCVAQICVRACGCASLCVCVCACVRVQVCMRVCALTYSCMCVCVSIFACVFARAHVCVCVRVCV